MFLAKPPVATGRQPNTQNSPAGKSKGEANSFRVVEAVAV
jgi:hypothetical protein